MPQTVPAQIVRLIHLTAAPSQKQPLEPFLRQARVSSPGAGVDELVMVKSTRSTRHELENSFADFRSRRMSSDRVVAHEDRGVRCQPSGNAVAYSSLATKG